MKNKSEAFWVARIVLVGISASITFNLIAERVLTQAGLGLAFAALLLFILIGVAFDLVGVAVTSASETPFHSMASHKEPGAAEALRLIRNADKVSSVCNDVAGDISSIVSGSTSAVIVSSLAGEGTLWPQLAMSALVAGLIIGGKAVGKNAAIRQSTRVVLFVGKLLHTGAGLKKKKRRA